MALNKECFCFKHGKDKSIFIQLIGSYHWIHIAVSVKKKPTNYGYLSKKISKNKTSKTKY